MNTKHILGCIGGFFSVVFLIFFSVPVSSQPSVIDIIPGDPTPQSNIRFVASNFVNETVENVTLVVQEYTNESPYDDLIIASMVKNRNNSYEATITLHHPDTTMIMYYVNCTVDGVVKQSPVLDLEITAAPAQTKSPGFELLFFIAALSFIGYFLRKRKK
jgi:hypothetical protein